MKKVKILTACILGAMLLIGSSLHSEAADVDRNKSMREVKSTKYTDDNGVEKTILWVDNITPPVMNGSNDGNADFKKIETTQGGNRYIEYVAPYKVGNGWYDINKTFDQDTFLCFSATASNMLHWWMDQNRGYIDNYLNGNPDIPKAQEIKKCSSLQQDSMAVIFMTNLLSNLPIERKGIGRIFCRINLSMDIDRRKTEERMTRSGMEKI